MIVLKKKIAITIDDDVWKAIQKLATKEDRTMSSQINRMLKEFLKEREK